MGGKHQSVAHKKNSHSQQRVQMKKKNIPSNVHLAIRMIWWFFLKKKLQTHRLLEKCVQYQHPWWIFRKISFFTVGKKIYLNVNAQYLFCWKRLNAVCVCRKRVALSPQLSVLYAMKGDARVRIIFFLIYTNRIVNAPWRQFTKAWPTSQRTLQISQTLQTQCHFFCTHDGICATELLWNILLE